LARQFRRPCKGGEGGGDGGDVTLTADSDTSTIKTDSDAGYGVEASSLAGSGGKGGEGAGLNGDGGGADVTLAFQGSIQTEGSQALGILAQSVGGFAGEAGVSGGLVAFGANEESAAGAVHLECRRVVGGGVGTEAAGAISQLGGNGSSGGDAGDITFSLNCGQDGSATLRAAARRRRS
jgi:hypothetical protein